MSEKLETLVVRAQTGDHEAYNKIVDRFKDMAINYAYAIVGDYELAEDARQEAFLGAYCDLLSLREPAAFPGWFRRIVHNRSVQLIRRGRRRLLLPLEEAGEPVAAAPLPDRTLSEAEERRRIQQAVGRLPVAERDVIRLFYFEERSLQEIGQLLDLPAKTIKSRLHTGRARLRQRLMEIVKKDVTQNSRRGDRRPVQAAAAQAISQVDEELQGVLGALGDADRRHAAELICTKGRLLRFIGRMDEARAAFEGGLELPALRRTPELRTLMRAELGLTWVHLSDYEQGRKELEAALAAARRQSAPARTLASILNGLGLCAWGRGELARARALYQEVVEKSKEAACPELAATAANNLALLDWKAGRLRPALAGLRQCLSSWKKLHNRHHTALTLMNVGILEENLGRAALARRHYGQALELAAEVGFGQVQAAAQGNLSNLALGEERWSEAQEAGEQALELARAIGDRRSQAIALENQSLAQLGLGRLDATLALVREARRLARAIGDQERLLSLELVEIEALTLGEGPVDKGLLARIEKVRDEASRLGFAAEAPRGLRLLGCVKARLGDPVGARRALTAALAESRRQGNRPEERRIAAAQRMLAD